MSPLIIAVTGFAVSYAAAIFAGLASTDPRISRRDAATHANWGAFFCLMALIFFAVAVTKSPVFHA